MTLAHILLIAIIFVPVFPIYTIEGISSVIRLDFVLSLLFMLLMFRESKFRRHIASKINLIIAVPVILLYLHQSSNVFIAIAQISLYFSLYCAYYFSVHLNQRDRRVFIDQIYFLLAGNCLIHSSYHFFAFDSFVISHSSGFGQIESDISFGLFGISKMPFQFILYVGAFLFISFIRNRRKDIIFFGGVALAFISASTSESRIGFFALFIGLFFTTKPVISAAIAVLAIIFIPYVLTDKMNFISQMNLSKITEDPSLGMRLINIENFIDWLSIEKMLFGGGAFANLEFTSTYGEAGALDILFIRILAEFGFPVVVCGLIYFSFKLARIIKISSGVKMRIVVGWSIFVFIYSILNEGAVASRSGHLVFLTFGLIVSMRLGANSFYKER